MRIFCEKSGKFTAPSCNWQEAVSTLRKSDKKRRTQAPQAWPDHYPEYTWSRCGLGMTPDELTMARSRYSNRDANWQTFIANCARQTLLRRCKEMLVARGCGMCARRFYIAEINSLGMLETSGIGMLFVFEHKAELPSDVLCSDCVRERMQPR